MTVAGLGLLAELLGYALIGLAAWAAVRARGRRGPALQAGEPLEREEVDAKVQSGMAALAAGGCAIVLAASAVGIWRVWVY